MNSTLPMPEPPRQSPVRRRWLIGLLLAPVILLLVLALGVASFFWSRTETTVLRQSVLSSVNGGYHRRVALNVGAFTCGLVRLGTHALKLPPEARAALAAVQGADVAVYQMDREPTCAAQSAALAKADRAMSARGWERVVGVRQPNTLVAIYCPRGQGSPTRLRCAVLCWDGRDLVLVSARANAEPLLEIAQRHLDLHHAPGALASFIPAAKPVSAQAAAEE